MTIQASVEETGAVDAVRFGADIATRFRRIVVRGQAEQWPAVRAGARSDESLVDYVKAMDRGRPAKVNRPRFVGRLQLLRRWSHDEQDDEQVASEVRERVVRMVFDHERD